MNPWCPIIIRDPFEENRDPIGPNNIQNRDLLETHIFQNRDPSNLSGQKRMQVLQVAKIL